MKNKDVNKGDVLAAVVLIKEKKIQSHTYLLSSVSPTKQTGVFGSFKRKTYFI